MNNLKGVRVAILVDNGFERAELTELAGALDQAGADTKIVSPQEKEVRAWETKERADKYPVQQKLDEAQRAILTR